jgi:DNA-binding transcriptional LysR family regulator
MGRPRLSIPPALRVGISELETFLTVARLGSFSAAALALNVTQPSITSRVQRLEAALGTRLLIRTTRKVELTKAGRLLHVEADKALAGLRKLVGQLRADAATARNRIVITATQMVAATILPDILRSYRERYPDVDVEVRDLRHKDTLQALAAGDADIGVIHFDGDDKRFRSQPLLDEAIVLVVPPSHPLANKKRASLDDLAAYPLMLLEQYEGIRVRIAAELARRGLALKRAQTAGNLTTLMGLLDAGMGILLLPRVMARQSLRAGHVVVELEGVDLRRTFSLVMLRSREPTRVVQQFSRHLRRTLAGHSLK